jgi:hypothetical protein
MDSRDYFFCPRIGCPNHRLDAGASDQWYYPFGQYSTYAFGTVQRYRCRSCGKTFSDQTFSLNYYLKKKTDFRAFAKQFNSRASDLFCARHFGYSSASMQTRVDRLARNALFMHDWVRQHIRLSEHLVADGLESFVGSKYFPNSLNLLIGKASEYVYDFNLSHSRRKGRMSDEQKQKAHELYADIPFCSNELTQRFAELVNTVASLIATGSIKQVRLHTDEHPVYQKVIEDACIEELEHHRTHSSEPRDQRNPLFAVNYFERLVRKDMVNHRRKSICFARNEQNMLSRFAWYTCAHNYFKPKRIDSQARQTTERHCSGINGIGTQINRWKPLIHHNRFILSFSQLSGFQRDVWLKQVPGPLGPRGKWNYLPKFALG